jgi:hypothetical protein
VFTTVSSYVPNSRGNKVEQHVVVSDPAGGARQWLYLRGPEEAAQQIQMAFGDLCRRVPVPNESAETYTHCQQFDSGVQPQVITMVELLGEILTCTSRAELDCAVVLDWYTEPPTAEKPNWSYTGGGLVLNRSKYRTDSEDRKAARKLLMSTLAELVGLHPLLRDAPVIVTCPGHAGDGAGFSEQLARRLGEVTGKQVVETVAINGPRLSRKEDPTQSLAGAFRIDTPLPTSVIVVDDVYQSGTTMAAVATAARAAGAERVFGLAFVRTMKA